MYIESLIRMINYYLNYNLFFYFFLAQTANQFYDNNRREVLNVLEPVFEEFCETIVLEMGNQILSTLPFEAMFVAATKNPSPRENSSSF